jgi:hypothetical protein
MKNAKHMIWFSFITIISFVLSFLLAQLNSRYFFTSHFWVPTVFFSITTLIVNLIVQNSEKNTKEFIFKLLIISMARLLLCMVFILVYSLLFKTNTLAFAVHFMLQYFLFTIYEVSYMIKFIKAN